MARTDNTMPYRIQREDETHRKHWTHYGGMFARVGRRARYKEKTSRQRARIALAREVEPEPARHRGGAKYDYY